MKNLALAIALVSGFTSATFVRAAENAVGIDVHQADKNVQKEVRRSSRIVKDKGCKLFHGKMHCAAEKAKHKAENAAETLGAPENKTEAK